MRIQIAFLALAVTALALTNAGPAFAGHRPAVGRAYPDRLAAAGQDSVGSNCS